MSMLSDFLRTLNEDELAKIRVMKTTLRELDVLQSTLHQVKQNTCDDAVLQKKLQISKSHFDKANSVLLDKCYNTLTDGSDNKVLYILWEKGLKSIMLHEVKLREKKLLSGSKKKLAAFYRLVFGICIRLPVLNGKIILAEHYGKKHLAALGKPSQEQQYEIWLQYLFATIFYYSSNGKMNEYGPWTVQELNKWEKKLKGKKYAVCNFFYHLCRASYYEFYTSDFPNLLSSLQSCLCEYKHGAERVGENYKIYVETKLANAYCHGSHFADALNLYRDAFNKYNAQLSRNAYHPLMFSVIAIINGAYDEAEGMMNKHLLSKIEKTPADPFCFDVERNYAVLYMYKKDFKMAGYYIQRGQQWDKTKFNFLGDILQRVVHNIYYVITNDIHTAASLLRKNIRFLNAKPQDAITTEYRKVFDVIADVLKIKKGKKPGKDFETKIDGLQKGIMKLYGGLLKRHLA
ncbi:MAG: hypothetical protein KA841_01490 [Chitinophagales bacterium]|nr:hypothetical protein [Chitinophagales bacterium]